MKILSDRMTLLSTHHAKLVVIRSCPKKVSFLEEAIHALIVVWLKIAFNETQYHMSLIVCQILLP